MALPGIITPCSALLEARGLILVSPTHNSNVAAWVKNFVDRLYCLYIFDDSRPSGMIEPVIGPGPENHYLAFLLRWDI